MDIQQLINQLNKYPLDTPVCAGTIKNGNMSHFDLQIKETHPIGDRDNEDSLEIWIGCDIGDKTMITKDNKNYGCSCNKVQYESHTCPFQIDINNDDSFECNCCPICEYECGRNI